MIGVDDADLAIARTEGLPGARNGMGDALRHCIWSCQTSRDVGHPLSAIHGWVHEAGGIARGYYTGDYDWREYDMDMANNRCGRDLSEKDNQTCKWACMNAYQNMALTALPR